MSVPGPKTRALLTVCVVVALFVGVFVYATRGGPGEFNVSTGIAGVRLPAGTRIVFFGDSITAAGVLPGGYVDLVRNAFRAGGADVDVSGSGVVGDTVDDLQRRLDADVLSQAPTLVVVYVGVNDVAGVSEGAEAAGAAAYREGIADLIDRIRQAGAAAVVCTPGLLNERPDDGSRANRLLDRYAGVVREVAAERGARVCDLRRAFSEYLSVSNPEGRASGLLTRDGVHLSPAGNRFVARQMLQALVP